MKAAHLTALAKLAGKISNPSSLSSLYHSIELGPEQMRCCSEFGILEIKTDPTGLDKDCLIDAASILSIAASLPATGDIELEEKNNKINWKSGAAKGHLNLITTDNKIPAIDHKDYPWKPGQTLADALLLASCACQAAAVSVGLYGITIEPEGQNLHLLSSNSISLASATVELGTFPGGKITLRPPVPSIIAALIRTCPGCALDVTKEGIFIEGDWLRAHLPLGVNLTHDLLKLAGSFTSKTNSAKIDNVAVKKFINRARALSDKNVSFTVGLRVEQGKLALEHRGIGSSTEEYFLAEGLDATLNFASVALPGDMLMLPLGFVENVIFDYLPAQQLVMTGATPEFLYVVGGEA